LQFGPQRPILFEKRQQFLQALGPFERRRRLISGPGPID
jgi:hypothetical protein